MSEAENVRPVDADQAHTRPEPGFGTALIAVGVILVTIAVLSFLIYILMIAIRPIESRTAGADRPVPETRTITPASPSR
jgi:hypothetical protein